MRLFVSGELMRAILLLDFCLWTESSWGKADVDVEEVVEDEEEEDEDEEGAVTPLKPVIFELRESRRTKKGEGDEGRFGISKEFLQGPGCGQMSGVRLRGRR